MSDATRDNNRVPSLVGASNVGDRTPVDIYADPTTHRLLVNATLTGVSSGDGAILDGSSSGIRATVFDYTTSNPLATTLVDTNGDPVSVGGGTQYTEDSVAAANPVGTAVNLIRKDTPAAEVSADGDNIAQRGTNYGAAYVTLLDTGGSPVSVGGGTQYTEDAAAAANPIGNAVNLVRQDTPTALVSADGDNVSQRGTNFGAAYTQIVTSTGSFVDTFGGGTQFADGAARGTATGTLAMVDDGTNIQSLSGDSTGKLNVNNISGTVSLPTGAATAAKQDTGNTSLASIDGKITAVNTGAVVVSSSALPAGASTLAEQQAQTTALQLIDDVVYASDAAISKVAGIGAQFDDVAPGTTTENSVRSLRMSTRRELYNQIRDAAGNERGANVTAGNALVVDGSASTQPISAASLPLPTGAATAALQTQPGVDIGDVTVNNASGASAVNIQDGGNSITVDGTVTANLAAGTNNIGDVDVLTVNGVAPAFGTGVRGATVQRVTIATDDVVPVSGTVSITTNSAVNVAQINGVTPLMGNGVTGTGSQRVTIASDNTAFAVNATLSAETTKVIGTVNQGTSPWVTSNATTSVVGNGAAATAQRVTLANDSTGILATVTSLTQMNGQAISMGTGVRAAGTQRVTIATDDVVPASQSGTWTVQPGNTANTTPWLATQTPKTSGGLTTFHLVSAGTTNATNVKASAGQVFGWFIYNSNAAARKVTFHNNAGTPTAGAGTFFSVVIPPTSGANVEFTNGVEFSTGIAITTTTDLADAGTTAVTANDLVINVFYK